MHSFQNEYRHKNSKSKAPLASPPTHTGHFAKRHSFRLELFFTNTQRAPNAVKKTKNEYPTASSPPDKVGLLIKGSPQPVRARLEEFSLPVQHPMLRPARQGWVCYQPAHQFTNPQTHPLPFFQPQFPIPSMFKSVLMPGK
jgi:hypothetical protein